MAIFPKGGTRDEGYAILPSHKQITTGSWGSPAQIRIPKMAAGAYHQLDKWLGWIATNDKIKSSPSQAEPRPPPTRGARGFGYDSMDSQAYSALEMEAAETAYQVYKSKLEKTRRVIELPADRMTYDPHGWEDNSGLYVNRDLDPRTRLKVLFHEASTQDLRMKTGYSHDTFHPVIEPIQGIATDGMIYQELKKLLEDPKVLQ